MSSFTCPFCGCQASVSPINCRVKEFNFKADSFSVDATTPRVRIEIYKCPNEECGKETIIAKGLKGYMDDQRINVYPRAIFRHFPDYVPEAIRQDYEEACQICTLSPKASATLSRRCLQAMIRDFWKVNGRTLNDEINSLQGKISPAQWSAIDALRQIGNIGAHMEKDTNLIVDISPDEADKLLRLIELLLDKWYVARHDEEILYAEITSTNQDLQDKRRQIC